MGVSLIAGLLEKISSRSALHSAATRLEHLGHREAVSWPPLRSSA